MGPKNITQGYMIVLVVQRNVSLKNNTIPKTATSFGLE